MADGGRAVSWAKERRFSAWEEQQLEQAAARLNGLLRIRGCEVKAPVGAVYARDNEGEGDHADSEPRDRLPVMRPGNVICESIAYDETGRGRKSRSTGMHEHVKFRGAVAIPVSVMRVEAMASLSWAGVSRFQFDLLLAYCREDCAAWLRCEPAVLRALPYRHVRHACRDAMARVMWPNLPRLSIEARARELRTRTSDYREGLFGATAFLRDTLAKAAQRLNQARDYQLPPPGASQGNGFLIPKVWMRADQATFHPRKRNPPNSPK